MGRKRYLAVIFVVALFSIWTGFKNRVNKEAGMELDNYNGVKIYFNGFPNKNFGRNLSSDRYNIGIKYQCVEFVKRYYLEHLNHKMPDTYGHAKDFFDKELKDGEFNKKRGLIQYSNPSMIKPQVDDIIIFKAAFYNPYGHIAIISKVSDSEIEIVQQNVWKKTREKFPLNYSEGRWKIVSDRIAGRLSIE